MPPQVDDLRVPDAAEALGLNARDVLRLVDAGDLPARRHPVGHLRIARDDIATYLAARTEP